MIKKSRTRAKKFHGRALVISCVLAASCAASSQAANITEFPVPAAKGGPGGIVSGPDGNLWFTQGDPGQFDAQGTNKIGKISPAGVVTEYSTTWSSINIVAGSDGNLWFTEEQADEGERLIHAHAAIGKITPGGLVEDFVLPDPGSCPFDIASGPDGNLWFTEFCASKIGRLTPKGVLTEFLLPIAGPPAFITAGPDGNLWFTVEPGSRGSQGHIGRITPTGVITSITLPVNYLTAPIVSGPDGNLWFTECQYLNDLKEAVTCANPRIAYIVPGSVDTQLGAKIKEFALPNTASTRGVIVKGPDGNLWFTDEGTSTIGRITTAGIVSEFPISTMGNPFMIATGPDGNLWFTEPQSNKIGRFTIDAAGTTISPGFTGNWFSPSQSGHGFSIEVLPGNQMLAQWYVFAPNGGQSWIVATGPITGNTAVLQGFQPVGSGGRFPPNFDPTHLQNQPWGTITFTFTDCNNGQVSWQPTVAGYTSGSVPITRLTMPAGLTCQ